MVTSGAIARGRRIMELKARPKAIDELQAASAVGQGSLFRAYEQRLDAAGGVHAAQVLLTAADLQQRTHYLNARQTLARLLAWKVVPVVNENDTTATDEITFGDNDFLAAQVAIMLEARLLVLLTDTAGLHTADPRSNPDAELISEVADPAELEGLRDRRAHFAVRARRHAQQVARRRDGGRRRHPGRDLRRDRRGHAARRGRRARPVGTRFAPHAEKASSFKLWLRYAKPTHGTLAVDDGAARVLRESGSSLLPVGITEVEGTFEPGDAVEIQRRDGRAIGKGVVNYSSAELDRIKGMRTPEVQELLPHASEEAVHRDYFVLT